MSALLSKSARKQIGQEAEKYPSDRRASAIMAALTIAQDEKGYLSSELIEYVAGEVNVPVMRAYEVATFYSMYRHQPCGEHQIKICTNISCQLRGSEEIVDKLKTRLGIELGEVTPDGKIGLFEVECLGACVDAPMGQLDKNYIVDLTPEKIDILLDDLFSKAGGKEA